MKTIVFIGTQKSGSSREAIKAAEELGYFTVVLTKHKKQIQQRAEYQDVHLMKYCDTDNLDVMKELIQELEVKGLNIIGIVSFVDSYVNKACQLADCFGINHFTTNAIIQMENKVLSRQIINQTSYAPQYIILKAEDDLQKIEMNYPLILKSPQSTGSKDVFKVEDEKELKNYVKMLREKYAAQDLLVEEYLEGPQYLVEAMMIKGRLYIIGVVKQDIEFINHHFIVTGYSLIINPLPEYFSMIKAVNEILRLHGLKNGACHLEIRKVGEVWKLIELNPRISGGGMNQLIKAGYGINLAKETIKLALNQMPNIKPRYRQHVYVQYSTISQNGILVRVTGKNKAIHSQGVLKVYVKPRKGNMVYKPVSLGHRYAYVLATGSSLEEATQNAKTAIKTIEFHIKEND